MRFGRPRSWIAFRNRAHTLRVRPGAEEDDCACGPDVLLTESGEPILSELAEYLQEEAAA